MDALFCGGIAPCSGSMTGALRPIGAEGLQAGDKGADGPGAESDRHGEAPLDDSGGPWAHLRRHEENDEDRYDDAWNVDDVVVYLKTLFREVLFKEKKMHRRRCKGPG